MSERISLKDLDKAVVLAALYNASKPLNVGFLHYDPKPMSVKEARQLLKQTTSFDYLMGRVMKINLSGDELDTWGYDRDNGFGAAKTAIDAAIQSQNVNNDEIQGKHKSATLESAINLESHLGDKSSFEKKNGMSVIHLGIDEFADKLQPKIDAVKKGK